MLSAALQSNVTVPAIDFAWVRGNAVLQNMVGGVISIALVGVGISLVMSLVGLVTFKIGIQPFGRTHGDYFQGVLTCLLAAICLGALGGAAAFFAGLPAGWRLF
jgi:hypothetical protein